MPLDRRFFNTFEILQKYWHIWGTMAFAIYLLIQMHFMLSAVDSSVNRHHTIDDARDFNLQNRTTIIEQAFIAQDARLARIERKIDNLK